jgi:hypothetical protein
VGGPQGALARPAREAPGQAVEDHELGHATFEARAGRHRGGPGTVIVWDTGELTNLTERDGEPVDSRTRSPRHLKVALHGQKLSGAFALTRTSMGDDPRNWILVKIDDDGADRERRPEEDELRSVLSGRTN